MRFLGGADFGVKAMERRRGKHHDGTVIMAHRSGLLNRDRSGNFPPPLSEMRRKEVLWRWKKFGFLSPV